MVLLTIIKPNNKMRKFLIALLLSAATADLLAQEVPVFTSGTEGFKSFRIPAITRLPGGELLAFGEGRVNGASDFGNVKIVTRKSLDQGKTWGALHVVVTNDTLQADNASPVMDMTDPAYPQGRLFLFYNTGNAPENKVRQGKGLREVWYKTSVDGGESWSAAVNITAQVHKPKQPQVNAAYNFAEDWRSYANGPGHAIQLAWGKYKGRIYIAANHSAGEPQRRYADGRAFGYYTDDHGKTFHIGNDVTTPGGNESTAAELSGNKLMINARNQLGNVKQRIVALSDDGGQTWHQTYFDQQLPDPVCQGSVLNIGTVKGESVLAFCNAADTLNRNNLTLRISLNEGKTWAITKAIAVAPAGYKGDYSAYSDLVKLDENTVGILYEKDNYKEIVFVPVKWK
jgi:sialidase-1